MGPRFPPSRFGGLKPAVARRASVGGSRGRRENKPALGVVLDLLLLARARDALDLRHRPAGFFRDLAILLDQETVRRLVAVEAAKQRARHLAVGALRAVLIDHVEHDELGIQSRFSWHDCSPCSCSLILVLRAESCSSHMTENKTPASL